MDYDLKNLNLHYKFELFWPNNFLEDFEKYQQNFDSSKLSSLWRGCGPSFKQT